MYCWKLPCIGILKFYIFDGFALYWEILELMDASEGFRVLEQGDFIYRIETNYYTFAELMASSRHEHH